MSQHRILLIDDEEEFTAALAERLEMRGMEVEVASSGEAALERVTDHDFDAVLLDLSMPRMSGEEVLVQLRTLAPRLRVMLFTGYAAEKEEFRDVDGVVQKPFRADELARLIRSVLDS